ncbi:MAG: CvpA family protein [Treponema sp.]|nr:CvpA family protein [Treponema sp.]
MTIPFTTFDYVLSVIILIFAVIGLIKGFVDNIFGKLALILGIISGCFFYDDAAQKLWSSIGNSKLANIVGFITVFVIVFLVIKILQIIISKIFSMNILKSLDKTLGFFFGIVEGFAVTGLLIFILTVQPFFSSEKLLEGSFYANLTNQMIDSIQHEVPRIIPDEKANEEGGQHV